MVRTILPQRSIRRTSRARAGTVTPGVQSATLADGRTPDAPTCRATASVVSVCHVTARLGGGDGTILATETVDTAVLPPGDRFEFWQSLVARETAPARIRTEHRDDFAAWVRVVDRGSLRIASLRYPSLWMQRAALLIRQSDPEVYQLALPTAGLSAIAQLRRESAIESTDFTFLDTSRPHEAFPRQSPTAPGFAWATPRWT